MIQALRYLTAFPVLTLWHGGTVIVAALRGVRQVSGGVYDRAHKRWGAGLLRAARIRLEVEHAERLRPDRPCVYVANHVSFIDIWALLAALPGTVRFVAKQELFRVPVFGQAIRAAEHIAIDRANRAAAFAAYDEAARAVRGGRSAIVFAEGTRSRDGRLLPFKKGPFVLAIAAQVPVVPVLVHGAFELMPRGALYPRRGTVVLRIGDAIDTAGLGYDDRDRLGGRARAALEGLQGQGAGPA